MPRPFARLPRILPLLLLAACSGERLHLHGTGLVLAPGDTVRIRASTLYKPHFPPAEVPAESLALSVSDPAVASLGPDGVLTAHRPGRVRISARTRELEDTATVVVRAGGAPPSPLAALDAGESHTCAATPEGRALCWGANDAGGVGSGGERRLTATAAPLPVVGETRLTGVQAGEGFSCGLAPGGRAYCWGNNTFGQLGDGSDRHRGTPAPVRTEARFTALAVGHEHACGLTPEGAAWCWGSDYWGELGTGTREDRPTPVPVRTGVRFTALTAGENHTCGLGPEARAWCWGSDSWGQLGSEGADSTATPVPVSGGHAFVSLAAGAEHTCGATRGGEVLCWGRNERGQLGSGTGGTESREEYRRLPAPVAGAERYVRVFAGGAHACGLTAAGRALCWGENADGQLGDGTTMRRTRPAPVAGGVSWREIAPGGTHTCAVARDGAAWCWGRGSEGQLGSGRLAGSPAPVRVAAPL